MGAFHAAGESDDAEVFPLFLSAEVFQELNAIHLGHDDVEQEQVDGVIAEGFDGLQAVGDGKDVIALIGEDSGEGLAGHRGIIYKQNTTHRRY